MNQCFELAHVFLLLDTYPGMENSKYSMHLVAEKPLIHTLTIPLKIYTLFSKILIIGSLQDKIHSYFKKQLKIT